MKLPVVALPGVLLGEASWHGIAVPTRRVGKREFYPHTFPGFDGRRGFRDLVPSPTQYAIDLAKRLDVYGLKRVHLLAHCSGCLPAIALALANPERVASLTMVAYWHGAAEWTSRNIIKVIGTDAYAKDRAPSLVARAEHQSRIRGYILDAVTDHEGMLQMARSIVQHKNKDVYSVTAPMHFVVGDQDAVTLPGAQIHVALRAKAVLTVVKDAGHCAHIEDPLAVYGRAEQFWTAHDGAQ